MERQLSSFEAVWYVLACLVGFAVIVRVGVWVLWVFAGLDGAL